MRSFFVQIFLSFWISTLITFVLAAVIFPSRFHPSYDASRIALDTALIQLGKLEIARGDSGCGDSANRTFFVLNEQDQAACGGSLPAPAVNLVADVRKNKRTEYVTAGSKSITALPFAISAKPYVAVLI